MNQVEKNLSLLREWIQSQREMIPKVLAKGSIHHVYFNLAGIIGHHVEAGLLHWRQGDSPVDDLNSAIDVAEEAISGVPVYRPNDGELDNVDFRMVRIIAYLVNRRVEIDFDSRKVREADDVQLQELLSKALYNEPYLGGVPSALERLASKKRQFLAADTYRTYFDLLDSTGDAERIDALVRQAEANYQKRARDGFFSGGPAYMGGGPDNPYMVDWELGAILKKIGYNGESIHRWRWN